MSGRSASYWNAFLYLCFRLWRCRFRLRSHMVWKELNNDKQKQFRFRNQTPGRYYIYLSLYTLCRNPPTCNNNTFISNVTFLWRFQSKYQQITYEHNILKLHLLYTKSGFLFPYFSFLGKLRKNIIFVRWIILQWFQTLYWIKGKSVIFENRLCFKPNSCDYFCYLTPTKLREGNVLIVAVSQSFCPSVHKGIPLQSPWPSPPRHPFSSPYREPSTMVLVPSTGHVQTHSQCTSYCWQAKGWHLTKMSFCYQLPKSYVMFPFGSVWGSSLWPLPMVH